MMTESINFILTEAKKDMERAIKVQKESLEAAKKEVEFLALSILKLNRKIDEINEFLNEK